MTSRMFNRILSITGGLKASSTVSLALGLFIFALLAATHGDRAPPARCELPPAQDPLRGRGGGRTDRARQLLDVWAQQSAGHSRFVLKR